MELAALIERANSLAFSFARLTEIPIEAVRASIYVGLAEAVTRSLQSNIIDDTYNQYLVGYYVSQALATLCTSSESCDH